MSRGRSSVWQVFITAPSVLISVGFHHYRYSTCLTLGKFLPLSGPQFTHLYNKGLDCVLGFKGRIPKSGNSNIH